MYKFGKLLFIVFPHSFYLYQVSKDVPSFIPDMRNLNLWSVKLKFCQCCSFFQSSIDFIGFHYFFYFPFHLFLP